MNSSPPGPWWLCAVVSLSLLLSVGCGPTSTSEKPESIEEESVEDVSAEDGAADIDAMETLDPTGERPGSRPEKVSGETNSPESSLDKSSAPTKNSSAVRMSGDAFRTAAIEGRTSVVEQGIESGIDIDASEPGVGRTALLMAAYNGHTDTAKTLIQHGATVDYRDFEGKTPLMHACTGPFAETVKVLIAAGADVNAKESTEGFTPLMMAATLGQPDIVKILLDSGAEKETMDEDDDKAIDHARDANQSEIVKLLE